MNMNKKYEFKCEKCKYSWLDTAVWFSQKGKEKQSLYEQGLECPNCGEQNDISGKEVKQ